MKGLKARRSERVLELDEVERRLKPFGRRRLRLPGRVGRSPSRIRSSPNA